MKKILVVIGVIVLLAVVMIGMETISLIKEEENTYRLTEETIAEATANMGDDVYSGELYLDGVKYQMPIAVQELAENGWKISDAITVAETTIPAYTAYSNVIYMNNREANKGKGASVRVGLMNLFDEEVKLEESYLYDIGFSTLTGNKVILPKGITLSSTLEEVEAAYGEPTEKKVYDLDSIQRTNMEYYKDGIKVSFTFEETEEEPPKMQSCSYIIDLD